MNNIRKLEPNLDQLRYEAEGQLAIARPPQPMKHTAEELLHEFQVYQIELEMQNETLRQAQAEIEDSRDRYIDLYDFAPVGYLTLSSDALISDMNLTGASLLGLNRARLMQYTFTNLIHADDREQWRQHFLTTAQQDGKQVCELKLQRSDGFFFPAQLNSQRQMHPNHTITFRISFTDISERKQAEQTQLELNEVSTALNVLLKRNTMNHFDAKQAIGQGIQQEVFPILHLLSKSLKDTQQISLLVELEESLNRLVSSFENANPISSHSARLTPVEVRSIAKTHHISPGKLSKTDLIKSIQAEEGNFMCFGTAFIGECDQEECAWREDCFDASKQGELS